MLTEAEYKIVVSTLSKRRAWLVKTLSDSNLDTAMKSEHTETLKVLESAVKKLGASHAINAKNNTAQKRVISIGNVKILIADDSNSSAELLTSMLEDFGVKDVERASDGREAFDKIKGKKDGYDIIFCDWDMPELSGLDVHKKAKDSNTLRDAHFCMVTGVTEAKKIREAIVQGVNDYVVKPVDGNILESKVKATIDAKAKAAQEAAH